jgi:hypothetical protein
MEDVCPSNSLLGEVSSSNWGECGEGCAVVTTVPIGDTTRRTQRRLTTAVVPSRELPAIILSEGDSQSSKTTAAAEFHRVVHVTISDRIALKYIHMTAIQFLK